MQVSTDKAKHRKHQTLYWLSAAPSAEMTAMQQQGVADATQVASTSTSAFSKTSCSFSSSADVVG